MATPLRLLLIEDNPDDAALTLREVRQGGYDLVTERVETADALRATLARGPWDVVVSDFRLPTLDAFGALAIVRGALPEIPFIVVSGTIGEETAVGVIRAGANDYLLKDRLKRLPSVIERELRERQTRHGLERALRQAQKMEAIGRLAGGVAHDFNNLLTAILGYAKLALRALPAHDPVHADVDEIRKAGERAAELTRQLLAFSRQQVLQPRVLDLATVLRDVEKILRRVIGEDVDLRIVAVPGVGRVRADPGQIEQVVMNLAVNARDAMPGGGRLTIEAADADLDEAWVAKHPGGRAGRHVCLAVTDTGHGMTAEVQAHLFEPFFTTKERGKGTGLGLSTVYGIVQQSGGHISVYSEPGRGSTFRVYLPRVEAVAEPAPTARATEVVAGGRETILLVEDEETLRALAARVLREAGYTVLEARNGGEALLRCERHPGPIALLLTDVVMPEMGGPELARRLVPLRPGLRVCFMSGYAEGGLAHQGTLDPGTLFLAKPFLPDALARKVREVLDLPPPAAGGG